AAALPADNRLPLATAFAVTSAGVLLCGTLVFLWRTHAPHGRPVERTAQVTLPTPVETVPEPVNRPKILLVDGNPSVLEFERAVFSSAGLDVACAENGPDAMRLLEKGQFVMAILDSQLSGEVSCLDLQNWIRTNRPEFRANLVLTAPSAEDAARI